MTLLTRARECSRGMLLARVVVGAGPLSAAALAIPAGLDALWPVLLAGLVGVLAAVVPDSDLPFLADLVVVVVWALGVPDQEHPLATVAAAALVGAHVAAVLAAYGPPALVLSGALVRRWLGRALLVLALAPAVWGVVVLTARARPVGGVWVVGTVAVVLLSVLVSLLLSQRPDP